MKKLITAVTLGLGLVASGSGALAQQSPPNIITTSGNCVTTGVPGDWTITCGDIGPGATTTLITPPSLNTIPAPVDLAPAPAPAPATETAVDASVDSSIADTDGDSVADADELDLYFTDPYLYDSDGDGFGDGEELFGNLTDPLVWDDVAAANAAPLTADAATETDEALSVPATSALDSDGDSVADADELDIYGTDPTVADSDGDGLLDGQELFAAATDPLLWDSDGNGMGDGEQANAETMIF